MYKKYFGLKENPFSIAPDPRYLYSTGKHQEALAHLLYGIRCDGGFVLLTGEVGTGKTTICRHLTGKIPENTDIALILNPSLTASELLATFCDELGIDYPDGCASSKILVDLINSHLLSVHARGRRTVLIIEEAQNLGADVLEQVRLLTNLETDRQKLLQIIMIGQPELRKILSRQDMRQLDQRITARYHLEPLTRNETAAYVSHRLAVAGVSRNLFPGRTIDALFMESGGIPRLINILCDRALLGAYVQEQKLVDKQTLLRASKEVFGKPEGSRNRGKIPWVAAGLLFTAAFILLVAFYPVMRPASEATRTDEPVTQDSREWPPGLSDRQSRDTAYQALFHLWKLPFKGDSIEACADAAAYNIQCMEALGTMDDLFLLNRPAVLKLYDGHGHDYYAALVSLQDRTATLSQGSKTFSVARAEIERRWFGEYSILWRLPENYRDVILPGTGGPVVQWLSDRLSLAEGRTPEPLERPLYKEDIVNRIKKFQLSAGLVPDGIVGPRTVIQLDNFAGSGDPHLHNAGKVN
jgi:general secretion pathway protein A